MLCHVIADADSVNYQDRQYFSPHLFYGILVFMKQNCFIIQSSFILLLFFSQQTALHLSAINGLLEISRLLLECNADAKAKDRK